MGGILIVETLDQFNQAGTVLEIEPKPVPKKSHHKKKHLKRGGTKLKPGDSEAIIAEMMMGASSKAVSRNYTVSDARVRQIWGEFRKSRERAVALLGPDSPNVLDKRLKPKAFSAVEAGLDATEDPYKRAHVGIAVLKGMGILQSDQANVNINQFIQSIPSEWRQDFLSIEAAAGEDNSADLKT